MAKKFKPHGMWGSEPFDFENKENNISTYISYMLMRTNQMFRWINLPETIPSRVLELYIQTNGSCGIAKHGDDLFAYIGGLGGEPDVYFMPTKYVVSNPAQNFSKEFKIGEDVVIIPNDSLYLGLLPMFNRYASQLAENDLSMRLVDINTRVTALLSAADDRTRNSAEKFISDIVAGKLGVISETALLDGIKAQPYAQTGLNQMTNLIEYHQYLKASFWNEIGLNANYNMKRESINSEEAQLNSDSLLPLVDDMLLRRQEAAEAINKIFGTNISVELASAWEDNQEELDAELEALENESDEPESDEEPEENDEEVKEDESDETVERDD